MILGIICFIGSGEHIVVVFAFFRAVGGFQFSEWGGVFRPFVCSALGALLKTLWGQPARFHGGLVVFHGGRVGESKQKIFR